MSSHDPYLFETNRLPYDIDLQARCPGWLKFVRWFASDDELVVRMLQDFCGSAFVSNVRHEKFLYASGTGANGKNSFFETLRYVWGGSACVGSLPLADFGSEFGLSQILDKRVNICEEPTRREILNEGIIKKFVSQSPFQANRKYKQPLVAPPAARLVIHANHFPYVAHATDGFWRRLLLLRCDAMLKWRNATFS